jgi:hypothetical protein
MTEVYDQNCPMPDHGLVVLTNRQMEFTRWLARQLYDSLVIGLTISY